MSVQSQLAAAVPYNTIQYTFVRIGQTMITPLVVIGLSGFHVCIFDHVSVSSPAQGASTKTWHWVTV